MQSPHAVWHHLERDCRNPCEAVLRPVFTHHHQSGLIGYDFSRKARPIAVPDAPAHILHEVDPMKGVRDVIAEAKVFANIG
ncbi:hypothetical protein QO003_001585 [Arthrobacter silviterrae]|uniref:Uncharacterized protein n=1 Tax=Arthrobacter silviterrae TaxID=2026658 RepID=A0ABX0DEU1_9MICC|nr:MULTISPECIES: hypothetical protein [Arthrobacter]MCU6479367.1 hypothetical protein [Arthrobacter sp. A2-55]MDQ0277282.1 hypothetical protein [Arthrobacter silviterrae]NGN82893.1 hypothetical protein [Arthrobacter silviterrae]